MCNNEDNPSWGAGNLPLARWQGSQYENDFSTPMGWEPERTYNNYRLPIVRKVSNDVIGTTNQEVTGRKNRSQHISFRMIASAIFQFFSLNEAKLNHKTRT